jgi:hypothetical protein
MVQKLYKMKSIKYEVKQAEGELYHKLSQRFGASVPLVYNELKDEGMTGYNVVMLLNLAK